MRKPEIWFEQIFSALISSQYLNQDKIRLPVENPVKTTNFGECTTRSTMLGVQICCWCAEISEAAAAVVQKSENCIETKCLTPTCHCYPHGHGPKPSELRVIRASSYSSIRTPSTIDLVMHSPKFVVLTGF